MREELLKQLEYVQSRIKEITAYQKIDIKQISDLQRYLEMQLNIISALRSIHVAEEHQS
ncbi:hypothetical protein [Bacillus subtilis]|uniref:hypothetical protein n=1 Tax=Bacillus subtilis TaxID=1423 RepID=UPI002DB64BDF|nr:hypothetical protein [Bacillus subtilis]MEC2335097.1 hypothetical protein [Bacillus subtilis]